MPLTPDLWASLNSGQETTSEAAIGRLEQRALDELRSRYRYSEVEIDAVAQSPQFKASARSSYLAALDLFRTKHRLPSRLRLLFPIPASRQRTGLWRQRA